MKQKISGTDEPRISELPMSEMQLDTAARNIIGKYSETVYRLAYSMVKNRYDADDIHQDVFVKYLKRTQIFENEEHEKAWFIKVTINCCRNYYKTAWKRHIVSMTEYETDSLQCERQKAGEMPGQQTEAQELIEIVKCLPEKYRAVIHLFYYEEMSVEEIATALSRRESTVRTQLVRARRMLGAWLSEEGK